MSAVGALNKHRLALTAASDNNKECLKVCVAINYLLFQLKHDQLNLGTIFMRNFKMQSKGCMINVKGY